MDDFEQRHQPQYEARFWSKVMVGGPRKCWNWKAGKTSDGYGSYRAGDRKYMAHRYAFECYHGRIPDDLLIRHTCNHRWCCNPYHLRTGTDADNMRDRDQAGRQAKGEDNGRSKLTEADVYQIRELWDRRSRGDVVVIARAYGVTRRTISNIGKRVYWRHLPERDEKSGEIAGDSQS